MSHSPTRSDLDLWRVRPRELSASAAASLIAGGQLNSETLVRDCLGAIAERDPHIHAFTHVDAEGAIVQARARDRACPSAALHGIPIGVKDIFDTADMPSEYNSNIYRGHRPRVDADCVMTLRQAGAVIIGKTVTSELAHATLGPTVNPYNSRYSPGGSSSGSAAAVAAQLVPLAIGSQTGGSTIKPASYCGVFGFKPTFGHVSTRGLKPVAPSLDTVGFFARCPHDIEMLYRILTSHRGTRGMYASSLPKVGIFNGSIWEMPSVDSIRTLEMAAEHVARMGCPVAQLVLPPILETMPTDSLRLLNAEMAESLRTEYDHHRALLSETILEAIEAGLSTSSEELIRLRDLQWSCSTAMNGVFEEFDVLICPSAQGEAPAARENGSAVFNRPWTMLHLPCLNVPLGTGLDGMPIGVQLISRKNFDIALLRFAIEFWERLLQSIGSRWSRCESDFKRLS